MSYLILNGEYSNRITGLLISELAPISLPPVRTQIETIDGRDGDIVTRLGYGAYDKTVSIGLFGNYDINEIIKFFSSEGNVTFSNEADKYYRYQILNQIDYNRLLRLKKADVVFHVQPFKYSVDEAPITGNSPLTVTNEGNTFSRPVITIEGEGEATLSLNGSQIFSLTLGGTMILDMETMNATDQSGNLLNRSVIGNFDSFRLIEGENVLTWSGGIDSVTVERYSRWL